MAIGAIPTVLLKHNSKIFNMVMKDEIYTIIRNDVPLRKKIADHLRITDSSVYGHAVRKAPKLNEYPVVRIIMEHTGKKEEEVFDMEPIK